MSINEQQRAMINDVLENEDTDYAYCGTYFLNGATVTDAQDVEREALEKIGDRQAAGNDDKIIEAIARWDLNNYSSSNLQRVNLYTLQHNSVYSKNLGASDEICCTSNSKFLNIANKNNLIETITPESDYSLRAQHNGKFEISNGIYYVGEKGKLFGREQPYAYAFSTSTAACVFGSKIPNPIVYQGYCFEAMRGRKTYATGGAMRGVQYFFLTPGGGPLNESNWIIKFNEYGMRYLSDSGSDTSSSANSSWVCKDANGNYYTILKIWIHCFFPDGSYVRTVIDRSDSAIFDGTDDDTIFKGVNPSMSQSWIYKDFANYKARQRGLTFSTVWNNYIYNKLYRPIGGYDPSIIDIGMNWNGKLNPAQQNSQIAYLKSNKTVRWKGGGLR